MKYVGLKISNIVGHEAAVESFIREYCIFERPEIPYNIAHRSREVNVYSQAFYEMDGSAFETLVAGLPFTAIPIGYEPPCILLVSTVNFVLEFMFNHELIRLLPTDYISGVPVDAECEAIKILVKRGCLRIYGVEDSEGWVVGSFNFDFNNDFDISYFEG